MEWIVLGGLALVLLYQYPKDTLMFVAGVLVLGFVLFLRQQSAVMQVEHDKRAAEQHSKMRDKAPR